MPFGCLPTGIVPTTTGSGLLSTRRTLSSPVEAIHATCLAAATPSGSLPTASGSPSGLVRLGVDADGRARARVRDPDLAVVGDRDAVRPLADVDRGGDLGDGRRGGRGRRGAWRWRWRSRSRWRWRAALAACSSSPLKTPSAASAAAIRPSPMIAGRRMPSSRARCGGPSGFGAGRARGRRRARPRAPPPAASAAWASRANSPAVCWRSSGCLASARSTTAAERGRELGPGLEQRRRRLVDVGEHRPDVRVAQERRGAREHVVEDAAERVDVRARVGVAALDRLG